MKKTATVATATPSSIPMAERPEFIPIFEPSKFMEVIDKKVNDGAIVLCEGIGLSPSKTKNPFLINTKTGAVFCKLVLLNDKGREIRGGECYLNVYVNPDDSQDFNITASARGFISREYTADGKILITRI